jgi:hypothetical protein
MACCKFWEKTWQTKILISTKWIGVPIFETILQKTNVSRYVEHIQGSTTDKDTTKKSGIKPGEI